MLSHLRRYFESVQTFVSSAATRSDLYFRRPGRDFTRRRLLPLERLSFLTLSLLKRSNAVELDAFFAQISPKDTLPVSKSALTQARQKLLPQFFEDWFSHSVKAFFQHFEAKRWKGFRLWATDGTGFRLPDCPDLGEVFGWHGNQHNQVPSSRLSMCYDLLNFVITDARLHPRDISEFFVATCYVESLPSDVLMVYDRGYASQIIPFLHQMHGSHCLIRIPLERSKTVQQFVASGKKQQIITEPLGERAQKSLEEQGIFLENPKTNITYRLIRIELPTGETEVLLTTLLDTKKYPSTCFSKLYAARWGIESCFFVLKSFLQIAIFSAHLPDLCHADIFSTFLFFNLQTAALRPLEPKIKQINRRRKLDYQPNRNYATGLLKHRICQWFLGNFDKIDAAIHNFHRLILSNLEAIRPDKNKERRRRLMRATERHSHEKNYRRAL